MILQQDFVSSKTFQISFAQTFAIVFPRIFSDMKINNDFFCLKNLLKFFLVWLHFFLMNVLIKVKLIFAMGLQIFFAFHWMKWKAEKNLIALQMKIKINDDNRKEIFSSILHFPLPFFITIEIFNMISTGKFLSINSKENCVWL